MLDPKFIQENPELVQQIADAKKVHFSVEEFLKLDEKRRNLQTEVDALRAEKNKAGASIASMQGDEKAQAIEAMSSISEKEKTLSQELSEVEKAWTASLLHAPGIMSSEVPLGADDSENVELYKVGEVPSFDFEIQDHIALGKNLDMVDVERGVKIAGSRNYFLKGDGALLEMAILKYTLDKLVMKGFTPFLPPLMVNYEAMMGTSYFPGGEEQAYTLEKDEKYLIGTSEVSVASYHSNEVLEESELPKLYAGYSYCFRREAGTYGKDTHGLYRIHQFQKVEQVILCKNDLEESQRLHAMILKNAEEVLQDLGLAYRVVAVCSGDMGQGQYYKNDIETWMPSRNSYGETHSCSNFLDFQARRLNTRYRDKDGKLNYVYTLNNTCIASPRILIPLMECYQNADGSITIPEVLRPYMMNRTRIEKASL